MKKRISLADYLKKSNLVTPAKIFEAINYRPIYWFLAILYYKKYVLLAFDCIVFSLGEKGFQGINEILS